PRRPGAPDRVRARAQGRVGPRAHRPAPRAGRPRRRPGAPVPPRGRRVRPAPQDAAPRPRRRRGAGGVRLRRHSAGGARRGARRRRLGQAGRVQPLTVLAPAKLTLSLRVTGVRSDGYHLLDAEMVTVDLADVLTFESGANVLPPDDLVSRALRAAGRDALVTVDKCIPVGAGLGGGSADAAAVLRWAGCDDLALAAQLGADVPFCLVGGRARVTGTGEVVEP